MKTLSIKKQTKILCAVLAIFALAQSVYAYPPDNAAVLYYRTALVYESNDVTEHKLSDFIKGKIELDEDIEKLVEKNRHAIDFALDAAEVTNCDWGMDLSKGYKMIFPHYGALKHIARLILVEARIIASQGDYEIALDRCLSGHKMARHISDRIMISYLVGVASAGMTNNCIQQILGEMPEDMETLNWLRSKLLSMESRPFSLKVCVTAEANVALSAMYPEKAEQALEISGMSDSESVLSKETAKRIRNADEEFYKRNRDYHQNLNNRIMDALDLPYQQAYVKLKQVCERPAAEFDENPDATLSRVFSPAVQTIYSLGVQGKTQNNAVRAAVEIYRIKARTGSLPDELPADLPKDLFSGEDFEYAKNDDGFILTCRGRDLYKDELCEYAFKTR